MADHVAQRTLVKSPPEIWAEVSEQRTLASRLEALGEIRITRLEPEKSVAWEGNDVRGTVELVPAGWGTTVTLRAALVAEPVSVAQTASVAESSAVAAPPGETAEPDGPPATVLPSEPPAPPVEAVPPEAPDPLVTPIHPEDPESGEHDLPPAAVRERVGWFARLFGRRPRTAAPALTEPAWRPELDEPAFGPPQPAQAETEPTALEPAPSTPAVPEPATPALDATRISEILGAVLDALGSAHHRPYSRS